MAKKTLRAAPCPVCKSGIEGITVEEDSILNAKRVPVIIPAKCNNGHGVVLFVDRTFTIRDVEVAAEVVQEGDENDSMDKAQKWMDSF
ncbi:MAG: hypothetical protein ACXADL_04300 [Candidatus Thorarchaeota archaeon]|jgi:hypothetical protein